MLLCCKHCSALLRPVEVRLNPASGRPTGISKRMPPHFLTTMMGAEGSAPINKNPVSHDGFFVFSPHR
jgi:hypothetical protein